ncbi:MAG: hypothetical protein R3A47_05705 [Polyangiales bacterium]
MAALVAVVGAWAVSSSQRDADSREPEAQLTERPKTFSSGQGVESDEPKDRGQGGQAATARPKFREQVLNDGEAPGFEERPLMDLQTALDSQDGTFAFDAIQTVVEAHDTDVLRILENVDLSAHPDIAPALIQAVADLGNAATESDRESVASTLIEWFERENQREGLDAIGNRTAAIEALASLNDESATRFLRDSIDRDALPLHLEVLASRSLLESGDPDAIAAVEKLEQRLHDRPNISALEKALREELSELVDETGEKALR